MARFWREECFLCFGSCRLADAQIVGRYNRHCFYGSQYEHLHTPNTQFPKRFYFMLKKVESKSLTCYVENADYTDDRSQIGFCTPKSGCTRYLQYISLLTSGLFVVGDPGTTIVKQAAIIKTISTIILSFATMFADENRRSRTRKAIKIEQRRLALYASYSTAHQKAHMQTDSRATKAATGAKCECSVYCGCKRSQNANALLRDRTSQESGDSAVAARK